MSTNTIEDAFEASLDAINKFDKERFQSDPHYGLAFMKQTRNLARDLVLNNPDINIDEKKNSIDEYNSATRQVLSEWKTHHEKGDTLTYGASLQGDNNTKSCTNEECTCDEHFTLSLTPEEESVYNLHQMNLSHINDHLEKEAHYSTLMKLEVVNDVSNE